MLNPTQNKSILDRNPASEWQKEATMIGTPRVQLFARLTQVRLTAPITPQNILPQHETQQRSGPSKLLTWCIPRVHASTVGFEFLLYLQGR